MKCEHCAGLQATIDDLTKGFKLMGEAFKLITQCEVATSKQLADLQLEIDAIKFGRDVSAL